MQQAYMQNLKFDFIFEFTICQRTDGTPTGHRRDTDKQRDTNGGNGEHK